MAPAPENTNNGATPATWEIAKGVLNATDIQRLACCYFYSDHTKVSYTIFFFVSVANSIEP